MLLFLASTVLGVLVEELLLGGLLPAPWSKKCRKSGCFMISSAVLKSLWAELFCFSEVGRLLLALLLMPICCWPEEETGMRRLLEAGGSLALDSNELGLDLDAINDWLFTLAFTGFAVEENLGKRVRYFDTSDCPDVVVILVPLFSKLVNGRALSRLMMAFSSRDVHCWHSQLSVFKKREILQFTHYSWTVNYRQNVGESVCNHGEKLVCKFCMKW